MRVIRIVLSVALLSLIIVATEKMSYADNSSQISMGHGSQAPTPSGSNGQPLADLTIQSKPNLTYYFKPYNGLAHCVPTQDIPQVANKENKTGISGFAGFRYLSGENSLLNFDNKYLDLPPGAKLMHEGKSPQRVGICLDMKF